MKNLRIPTEIQKIQLIILKEKKEEMWNICVKTLNILEHVNIKNTFTSSHFIKLKTLQ